MNKSVFCPMMVVLSMVTLSAVAVGPSSRSTEPSEGRTPGHPGREIPADGAVKYPEIGFVGEPRPQPINRPVVVPDAASGEAIATRSMVYLALSYDHRLVDGADAARFLAKLKDSLEQPLLLRGYFSERTHPMLSALVPRMQDLLEEYRQHGSRAVTGLFRD